MAVAPAAPLGAEAWEAWRAAEDDGAAAKRRLEEARRRLINYGKLVAKVEFRRARRARVRTAFCKAALREKLLRARRRRAGRRIAGLVTIAMARSAARRGGRAVRFATTCETVWSLHRNEYPPKRRVAQPATTRRPRLVNAAAIGPVMWGILQTFEGDEFG